MPIFEDAYQPWVGRPQPRIRRTLILAREEFRLIFSGIWMKIAIGLLLAIASGLSFVFFIASSSGFKPGVIRPEFSSNMVYRTNFVLDAALMIALAAISTSGLIAKDLRSNAAVLYFSRPIGRADYLAGKFLAAFACMGLGTFLPNLVLWAAAAIFKVEDLSWSSRFLDLGSVMLHALLITAPAVSIILAISSCTRWTAAAGVIWIMLFLVSGGLARLAVASGRDPLFGLMSLGQVWVWLGDFIYEQRSRRVGPANPSELWQILLVLGGVTAVAWGVLIARVRRIERS